MKSYQKELISFNTLVQALEKLPSIGKKSAMKMAYALAVENASLGMQISQAINDCILDMQKCKVCGGLSISDTCHICLDTRRNNGTLCIVGNPRDIFLVEEIGEFSGFYCVLEDYNSFDFGSLVARIKAQDIKEIIFAFTPSLQSDLIATFILDKLGDLNLRFSKIAQGVPLNVSLDNVDNISLAKAFSGRVGI